VEKAFLENSIPLNNWRTMRRAIYTLLIWTLLLASCGTFDVTLTTSDALTQTPSTDSSAPATAPLGMDSSSEQIRQTLLDSPFQWRTIFMDAQVTSVGEAPRRVQAWVDQPALSLRVLSGPPEGSAETFRVADGMSLLELDLRTGKSSLSPFLGETISLPYTPQPPNMNTSVGIEPHPLSTAVDAALGTLLFPSDIAQNEGNLKPIAMEVLAYKLVLVVEWRYIQNDLPSYRAWVDISTGLFLRLQQFEKSGGTDVLSEVTVTRVDYDLPFSPDLFSPVVYVLPDFVNEPQMPLAHFQRDGPARHGLRLRLGQPLSRPAHPAGARPRLVRAARLVVPAGRSDRTARSAGVFDPTPRLVADT
jgi:hypothetical protein